MLPHDDTGKGPAVVLLHAGVADRTMWDGHLEPLAARGLRAIAPDLPGFGEAALTPGPRSPWNDVLGLLDDLGVARAALVGSSFGGAVALRLAAAAPERVGALVLVSAPAPGLAPSPRLTAIWETEERALAAGDVVGAVDAVVEGWTLPGAPVALRERVAAMQRRAYARQAAAGEVAEAPDPVEEDPAVLGRLGLPAVVAVGEHDLGDFHDAAAALASALGAHGVEVIPGAGHLAPLEAPEAFRALVVRALAPR